MHLHVVDSNQAVDVITGNYNSTSVNNKEIRTELVKPSLLLKYFS